MLCFHEDKEKINIIADYTFKVLDALGIAYGAAHTEIMWVEGRGPVLIETGARLNGGIDLSAYTMALGYNQLSLLMESILSPKNFLLRPQIRENALHNSLRVVFLRTEKSGNVMNKVDTRFFQSIKNVHSIFLSQLIQLTKTVDFLTSSGYINLVGSSNDMDQGLNKIRWSEENFYKYILGE
jgi:hypothetical protein